MSYNEYDKKFQMKGMTVPRVIVEDSFMKRDYETEDYWEMERRMRDLERSSYEQFKGFDQKSMTQYHTGLNSNKSVFSFDGYYVDLTNGNVKEIIYLPGNRSNAGLQLFSLFNPNYTANQSKSYGLYPGTELFIVKLSGINFSHESFVSVVLKEHTADLTQAVFYQITSREGLNYSINKVLANVGFESPSALINSRAAKKEEVKQTKENNNKETEKMANVTNNPSMIETTVANAKAALAEGVQLAVSNQASEVVLGLVSDVLGVDHPVLQTAEGRALAKVVGSLLAETVATSVLDPVTAKQVSAVCQNAATFNVASLLNGKLDVIRPRLLQLVNVASMAPVNPVK